jgi:hypothetical protein
MWSASRPGRFTRGGNSPWYPWDRRLDGPQSQSGRRGEEKILDPPGTQLQPAASRILRYTSEINLEGPRKTANDLKSV